MTGIIMKTAQKCVAIFAMLGVFVGLVPTTANAGGYYNRHHGQHERNYYKQRQVNHHGRVYHRKHYHRKHQHRKYYKPRHHRAYHQRNHYRNKHYRAHRYQERHYYKPRRYYRPHRYSHRHHHNRRHRNRDAAIAAGLAGFAIGAIIASKRHKRRHYYRY